MDVVTADSLCVEVSRSSTAVRYKLDLPTIKQLWKELSLYVSNALKTNKGVLLPSLGYFSVGSTKGDKFTVKHKIRPTFNLQEGRFNGVAQETPKYHLTGMGAVLQPNYNVIGATLPLHRSVVQHVIKQLLQRVALHIAAGHFVQLDFPTLGRLVTNKAGRLEFQFELALLEVLDSSVHQRMQQYRLADAALREHDDRPTTAGSRSLSAPKSRDKTPTPRRRSRVILDDDLIERDAEMIAFDYVRQLCRESDRVGSGFVDRLQLEQWLHQRCRTLLSQLDALAFLDLLYAHTHGSAGRFIRYNVFLDSLLYQTQLKNLPELQDATDDKDTYPAALHKPAAPANSHTPAHLLAPRPHHQLPLQGPSTPPALPTSTSAPASPTRYQPPHPFDLPGPQYSQPTLSPPSLQPPPHLPPFSGPPTFPEATLSPGHLQTQLQQQQQQQQQQQYTLQPLLQHPLQMQQHQYAQQQPQHQQPHGHHSHEQPRPVSAGLPVTPSPWGGFPYEDPRHEAQRLALHSAAASVGTSLGDFHLVDYYKQRKATTPVTRSDCDDFNRYHFTRLFETRGSRQALAPKVQQDPLNVEDAAVSAAATPFLTTPRLTPRGGSSIAGASMVVQTGGPAMPAS